MIKNNVYLIAGVSKSGFSICQFILKNGGICYFYEDDEKGNLKKNIEVLIEKGAKKVEYEFIEKNIDIFNELIISPGVPINHKLSILFKKNNKPITGEFDFTIKNSIPTYIAVTGTNGKTTTVSLIDHILKKAKMNSYLVGNIGVPISSKIEEIKYDSVFVCEISSFQLETINYFSPKITCILNISEDHLDRHYTMDNYIFLKKKILQNCKTTDYVLLNYDDVIVKEFANDLHCNVLFVSIKNKKDIYAQNDKLYYKDEEIIDINNCLLKGVHNIYNMLFAVGVAKILKLKKSEISNGLKTFSGIKHRIEYVCEKKGVYFYNDSKATNSSSTITAINSINKPIILILGGSDKNENYDKLFLEIKNREIKHVILTGDTINKMLISSINNQYYSISVIPDFNYAVKFSYKIADKNDIVLLSPATASFDNFNSYEQRGETFCEIVKSFN